MDNLQLKHVPMTKPVDRIALLRCPILIIGGTDDQHTTVADTERLYGAARQPKELWLIPNTAHVDYLRAGGEDYRRRALAFFDRTLRIARPAVPHSSSGDLHWRRTVRVSHWLRADIAAFWKRHHDHRLQLGTWRRLP